MPIILELSDKIADSRDRPFTPSSSQRRPVSRHGVPESVPDPSLTPSPRTSPEKSSARDGFRPKRATRRPGDGQVKSAPPSRRVVWPRGAPYGLRARPWRPSPHLVARSRFGDSSRSGDGLARRRRAARASARAAESAFAPRHRRTSGGPARARPHGLAPRGAHPAVRENPIETPRPPSPALPARAVHGAPLQLPRVVDRRSTSRSELPSRAKSTAQVSSSPSSFPMARSPRRNRVEGGRPDVPTKGGVAARL